MTQPQSTLQMKTYFSTTVEAAIELARRELGPEAMLVNSRPTPEDVRHMGRYEVIFATGGPVPDSRAQPHRAILRKSAVGVPGTDTHLQLEDIRLQLTTIRQSLWSSRPESEPTPSDASLLRRSLEANGVESSLSRDLVHAVVRQNSGPMNRDQFRSALRSEMERRIEADPGLQTETQRDGSVRSIVAMVGPPGRGKSTMLVKLAIAQGLARKTPVRILSMDNHRIGASEQMKCYAAILGVSFHACESIAALDHQLSNAWGADLHRPILTLIDTSGYGPTEVDDASDLAAYFSSHPEINVQLVLRADSKTVDGIHAVQRYLHFGVSRLVFTGMDEAATFGSVYSVAVQTSTPVSFLGTGQRIPEDLELASNIRLVHLVLEGKEAAVSAAA